MINKPILIIMSMVLSFSAMADELPYDRVADNATTFVKGIVLFVVLALFYAFGKRFGLLHNEPNHHDQSRDLKDQDV